MVIEVESRTVMVAGAEIASAHKPLLTTARYTVVVFRLLKLCDVVMFDIGDHVLPPLMENSQRIIFPVKLERVNAPLFIPEHTVASGLTVPPTVVGFTVNVTMFVISDGQAPVNTQRYCRPVIAAVTFIRLSVPDVSPVMSAIMPVLLSCHW